MCVAAGCSKSRPWNGDAAVAEELRRRTGLFPLAADVDATGGGLTEVDAVRQALAQNAAFQERLAELGLSRADVIEAGLLPNPDLQVLFPLSGKNTEATLTFPLEFLWLRGRREHGARRASEATTARLVHAGMDLVRDVRLAYADLVLARRRLALLRQAAELRQKVADLAAARVRAGDATPLDELTARVDALSTKQEAARLTYEEVVAEERLRALLGIGLLRSPLDLAAVDGEAADAGSAGDDVPPDELVASAVADRSDAIGASLAVAAARDRARLARSEWLLVSGIVDANENDNGGYEAGPGVKLTLPLLNQNQGAVARAEAELERARRQQRTVRDRIVLDVREAHARLAQAREQLRVFRTELLPAMERAVDLAEKAYQAGETPFVQVLDASRLLLDARVREAQAAADLRKARAELERAVGRRLDLPRPDRTTEQEQ